MKYIELLPSIYSVQIDILHKDWKGNMKSIQFTNELVIPLSVQFWTDKMAGSAQEVHVLVSIDSASNENQLYILLVIQTCTLNMELKVTQLVDYRG